MGTKTLADAVAEHGTNTTYRSDKLDLDDLPKAGTRVIAEMENGTLHGGAIYGDTQGRRYVSWKNEEGLNCLSANRNHYAGSDRALKAVYLDPRPLPVLEEEAVEEAEPTSLDCWGNKEKQAAIDNLHARLLKLEAKLDAWMHSKKKTTTSA